VIGIVAASAQSQLDGPFFGERGAAFGRNQALVGLFAMALLIDGEDGAGSSTRRA
jgi:hypothetical protein